MGRPRHDGALALQTEVIIPVPVSFSSGAAVVDAGNCALAAGRALVRTPPDPRKPRRLLPRVLRPCHTV